MRIIGGDLGGRGSTRPQKCPTPARQPISPKRDCSISWRTTSTSVLRTLDLFGGTGSISYELASRGVPDLTVVEKDPAMFSFIQKTAAALDLAALLQVVRMDVFDSSNGAPKPST